MLENNKNAVTVIYSGGDIQVPFLFYDAADLVVLVETTPQKAGQDYTVSGAGNTTGGKVAFVKAPADGDRVTVIRKVDFTQLLSIPPNGIIPEGALTKALDRIVMMVQQLAEQAGRAVTYPEGTEKSEVANAGEMIDKIDDAQVKIVEAAALASDVVKQANDVLASTQQAKKDAELLLAQADLPDLKVVDEGRGLVVKQGGAGYDVGGTAASFDVGEAPEDLPTNERVQGLVDDVVQRKYAGGIRNVIMSGRVKYGQPAYLVHPEYLPMSHETNVMHGATGTVSSSGDYDANYNCASCLTNQDVYVGYGWTSPNGVHSGWWQYDFTKPRVIVGLMMSPKDNSIAFSLKDWAFQGWDGSQWVDIYVRHNDQGQRGYNNAGKDYNRMYWFTGNSTAYQRVRIRVYDIQGIGSEEIRICCLKFFEATIPAQDKYDVALYATEKEPFIATVASGLDAHSVPVDATVTLKEHANIDGHKFAECSRNYVYLVPTALDGSLPAGLNQDKATVLPDGKGFLYVDHRKVHYGSIEDIERECLLLLQSRHEVDYNPIPNVAFETAQGAYPYPLKFYSMRITTAEKWRGAPSAYQFTGGNNYIYPNKELHTEVLGTHFHQYANEFTLEMDFKFMGAAAEASDAYYCLFDSGVNSSKGFNVNYRNRQKTIGIGWKGRTIWYSVPFDAADGQFHTLSLTRTLKGQLHIHVDGKLIVSVENTDVTKGNYTRWMIGRYMSSDAGRFIGCINNVRYTLGTALYTGEDYEVAPQFHLTLVPHKTLWYDAGVGCVKEYDAERDEWNALPMLPLGEVVTGYREHTTTDQPRGTHHISETKYMVPSGFVASGQYDGNYKPECIFNFGHGGGYPWLSSSVSQDHFVEFELDAPRAFDRLRFMKSTQDWRDMPVKFVFKGSNDKQNWTVLLDHSGKTYENNGGGFYNDTTKPWGDSPYVGGYKEHRYDNVTPFKCYRFDFPVKTGVTFYEARNYMCLLLQAAFKDSKPELQEVISYLVGETYSVSNIPIKLKQEYVFNVPLGEMPFDVVGEIETFNDPRNRKRLLGQHTSVSVTDKGKGQGEVVFTSKGTVTILTGGNDMNVKAYGDQATDGGTTTDSNAMLSFKCKRVV